MYAINWYDDKNFQEGTITIYTNKQLLYTIKADLWEYFTVSSAITGEIIYEVRDNICMFSRLEDVLKEVF